MMLLLLILLLNYYLDETWSMILLQEN